jgi:hypothetical protein
MTIISDDAVVSYTLVLVFLSAVSFAAGFLLRMIVEAASKNHDK